MCKEYGVQGTRVNLCSESPLDLTALRAYNLLSHLDAGWSSPVARQAHNLEVIGSNPVPATNFKNKYFNIHQAKITW